MTRIENFKKQLQEAETRLEHLHVVPGALRFVSDEDSTCLLARMRLGASIDELVESIRSGFPTTDLHHRLVWGQTERQIVPMASSAENRETIDGRPR